MSDIIKAENAEITFNDEQVDVLKNSIAKDLTDSEFQLFIQVCKRKNLDPFSNQIHPVKRFDSKLNKKVLTIQTGIDGYRAIAQRSQRYNGQTKPEWCGSDGKWLDVWLSKEPPAAARIGVYLKGQSEPVYGVALWSEYYPGDKMGFMWRRIPTTMLSKVAEAMALRKAFPLDLSGYYIKEELENEQEIEVKPEDMRKEKQKRIQESNEVKEAEVINPFDNQSKDELYKICVKKLKEFSDDVEIIKMLIQQTTGKEKSKELSKDELIVLITTLDEVGDNKENFIDELKRNE